jgi:hypothetical protein
LLVYWLNIPLLGVALYWSWSYATRTRLLADDAPAETHSAVVRRIVIAQSRYAGGAALCLLNPYDSIAAMVLAEVNYKREAQNIRITRSGDSSSHEHVLKALRA